MSPAIDGAMQTSPIAPLQNKQVDIVWHSEGRQRGVKVFRPLVNQMRTKLKNCSTHCKHIYLPVKHISSLRFCVLTLENSFNKYGGGAKVGVGLIG